jgi:hypothetical protein
MNHRAEGVSMAMLAGLSRHSSGGGKQRDSNIVDQKVVALNI